MQGAAPSEYLPGAEHTNTVALPTIEDALDLIKRNPEVPPVLVEGIVHQGSKLVLGGASKSNKTWVLIDLALSIAAVLGVSISALSKWETGERTPNGAAAKLIFVLYHVFLKTGKVKNAWDMTVWGCSPCRERLEDKFAELNGTHFLTNAELLKAAEESLAEPTQK
jgi:transcriptional regulator with XRE-family HTH domain